MCVCVCSCLSGCQVSDEELQVKSGLMAQHEDFHAAMAEAESTLKKQKVSMKKTVQEDLTAFSSHVADIRAGVCIPVPHVCVCACV